MAKDHVGHNIISSTVLGSDQYVRFSGYSVTDRLGSDNVTPQFSSECLMFKLCHVSGSVPQPARSILKFD